MDSFTLSLQNKEINVANFNFSVYELWESIKKAIKLMLLSYKISVCTRVIALLQSTDTKD